MTADGGPLTGSPNLPDQVPATPVAPGATMDQGQVGQGTGNDGYTEDDVPMMSVGPPTQTHPDQVTSKPRQMPSGGGSTMGNPMGVPGADGNAMPSMGDQQPAPGQFDPAASGLDVDEQRAEDNDTSTDKDDSAGDEQPGESFTAAVLPRIEAMVTEVLTVNPGLDIQSALKISVASLGSVIRSQSAHDLSMWNSGFDTSGSPVHRMVDRYQVKKPIGPTPQEVGRRSVEMANTVVDKLRKKIGPLRPERAPGQGPPLPPDHPDAPTNRQPDMPADKRPKDDENPEPYQDSDYQEPRDMGEWVRGQMKAYGPEAVRDLWKLRYDNRPSPHRGSEGESR